MRRTGRAEEKLLLQGFLQGLQRKGGIRRQDSESQSCNEWQDRVQQKFLRSADPSLTSYLMQKSSDGNFSLSKRAAFPCPAFGPASGCTGAAATVASKDRADQSPFLQRAHPPQLHNGDRQDLKDSIWIV